MTSKPIESPARPVEVGCGPARERVILAEDDGPMRRILAAGLRKNGYEVSEFTDGADLLEHVVTCLFSASLREKAAAIVSDIRMPGISGLRVLHGLRAFDAEMPVILITAFGDNETRDEAQKHGAVLIDKPFELTELLAAIRASVERRQSPP